MRGTVRQETAEEKMALHPDTFLPERELEVLMKNEKHTSVVRLTSLALLAALIVVLQTVASGIKIGPVPISLTLVPIVVGAILFGPGAGAFLGGVFGVVCLIAGIAGTDQFTNLLWVANPFCLTVICVGKAVLCGWVAGLVYRALEKRQTLGCIAAAICAPIVNTGVLPSACSRFLSPFCRTTRAGRTSSIISSCFSSASISSWSSASTRF